MVPVVVLAIGSSNRRNEMPHVQSEENRPCDRAEDFFCTSSYRCHITPTIPGRNDLICAAYSKTEMLVGKAYHFLETVKSGEMSFFCESAGDICTAFQKTNKYQ